MPGKKAKTVEETYQKLTPIQHVLQRTETYAGAKSVQECEQWVLDTPSIEEEDGDSDIDTASCASGADEESKSRKPKAIAKFVLREIGFIPALFKVFDEVLVNAADRVAEGDGTTVIKVTIDDETSDKAPNERSISVWNNGKGIPIQMHQKEQVYVPEMIFGHLLTSSNYDDSVQRTAGGRNGYGAKLANILARSFSVETVDLGEKKRYRQRWRDNMSVCEPPKITSATNAKEEYTCVTFTPDYSRFSGNGLSSDMIALMKRRVYDLAGCLSGVKVFLNGKRIAFPVASAFRKYIECYGFQFAAHERSGDRWEYAVAIAEEGQGTQISFVNTIATTRGGTHVEYVRNRIVRAVQEALKDKKDFASLRPMQIRQHLHVFVNCLIVNPEFDSQTKETLTTQYAAFGSECRISEDFVKSLLKKITPYLKATVKFSENVRAQAALNRNAGEGRKARLTGIPKLLDADLAGTRDSTKAVLILTEGDSAKTLAVSGIQGDPRYGAFPLRGKLLNVRDVGAAKLAENEEISALCRILNLKFGKSADNLRYGSVMIMTDQDHDGSHIKGLIINFFHHFWPSLIQKKGFLTQFITPIVRCTRKQRSKKSKSPSSSSRSNGDVLSFYSIPEYRQWREENDEDVRSGCWTIKYYKGLGTSTKEEAREYFNNMQRHRIEFSYGGAADDEHIAMAFDKKAADKRKNWILAYNPKTDMVDFYRKEMSYTEFVSKELVLFSIVDCERSIPSLCDGLKPGQRKILYACLKRRLHQEIKVAQLAGYVSEHSAYHHGEQSLMSTIIGMAQDYVGANNIALLEPHGQFGSRRMGGKDAASPRYIFTMLSDVVANIFHADDSPLLNYLDDDGFPVEPDHYQPIIPFVLINGAEGIGTGWSTNIPAYNPLDIIEVLEQRLMTRVYDGDEEENGVAIAHKPLVPWYRDFRGTIKPVAGAEGLFSVRGLYHAKANVLHITELPVGTWTQNYIDFLDSIVSVGNGKGDDKKRKRARAVDAFGISDYKSSGCTDTEVHFEVVFESAERLKKALSSPDFAKQMHLETTLNTNNMHLFDCERKMKKYKSPYAIIDEWFPERMRMYGERREYLIGRMKVECKKLSEKARFIEMVVEGDLVLSNRPDAAICTDLHKAKFSPSPPEFTYRRRDQEEARVEEVSEEDGNNARYSWLLGMPLRSLTKEKVRAFREERDRKLEEMKKLEQTSPEDMWIGDLQLLRTTLSEAYPGYCQTKHSSALTIEDLDSE